MANKSTRTASEDTQIAVMANDLKYLRQDVTDIKNSLSTAYVPLNRYVVVEKIVFGVVGLILIAVFGAIMKYVVK